MRIRARWIERTDWIYFSSIGEHTLPFHHKVADYLKRHPDVRMGFNPGHVPAALRRGKTEAISTSTPTCCFVNREEAELVLRKKEGTDIKALC